MSGTAPARTLGAWSLFALGVNGIVGVGIFFAPAEVAASAPGLGSVLVFAATGLALIPVALAVAKLASRIHDDGATVLYARIAFGERAGFLVGWVTYVSALLSTSAVLVGLSHALLGDGRSRFAAAGLCTLLAAICAVGLTASARVWSTLTVLKLLPLIALAGLIVVRAPAEPAASTLPAHADWLRAALTATFVFQGFEIVPLLSGRARRPAQAIPRAVLGSLLAATLLYLVLQRGASLALPDLAHDDAPLPATARALGSPGLARIVALGTSVSALGIAFGMMTTTPHYLAVLAPGTRFAAETRGVPRRALAVTWALVMVLVLALDQLGELLALSSLAVVFQFVVVAAALVRLAWTRAFALSPRDAWSAAPTFVVALGLLSAATLREWGIAVALVALGGIVRIVRDRRRDAR